jgi:uncharacterized repeat protein (TIGR01451 family)
MKTTIKWSFISLLTLFALVFGLSGIGPASAAPVSAPPAYYPSGPQTNINESALIGWYVCWSGNYGATANLTNILNACDGEYLMMASRPTGSTTFELLAAAPRADVIFDVGNTRNSTHVANGTNWYFDQNWSWGFAKGTDPVDRNSCDVLASSLNPSGANGNLRLCWHTNANTVAVGWRSGIHEITSSSDTSYQRFIFEAGVGSETSTPTLSRTPTRTNTSTQTATLIRTSTPTLTRTNTKTSTVTTTPTITQTPTITPIPLYSLGNRVWFDTDNSGSINGAEVGINGVTVNLYAAGDLGTIIDTKTTVNGGYYLFNNLQAGNYVIAIPASELGAGETLEGYWSSGTSRTADGALVETTTAANSDIDSDDNGTLSTSGLLNGAVTSSVITLGPGASEPTDETDLDATLPGSQQGQPNAQANMTVDFGFYTITLGNLVWNDVDNSGLLDGSEVGYDGVTVQLISGDGSTLQDTTTTSGGGLYSFASLPAGNYIVRLPAVNFNPGGVLRSYRSSTGPLPSVLYEPAPDADTNLTNSDDNGTETNGLLELGGYIQTLPVTLAPGAEESSNNAAGFTLESRVDFGVNKSPQLDLSVTKDDGQSVYTAGDTLNYTIVVTNNGPADAGDPGNPTPGSGMTVNDPRPAQITSWTWTCASAVYGCTNSAPNSTTDFTDELFLPQLGSVTYHVVAQVAPTASGDLVNSVTVIPPTGMTDQTPSDNTATDIDYLRPTVTINQAAGQSDPTSISPIHFTAVFSEPVSGFTGSDIRFNGTTLKGTLSATIAEIAPMDGTTYDVAVRGMIPKGTVFVGIPAGSVNSTAHPVATNAESTSTDDNVIFDYVLAEFTSTASKDGWLLESTETSAVGGSLSSTTTTIPLGDDASDRQYRGLVDFATGSLPDDAVIFAVNLRIVEFSVTGTNPFSTHGLLKSEIQSGFFGTAGALQTPDFEFAPDQSACNFETIPEFIEAVGTAYRCIVFNSAFPYINLTGSTQFRLRFATDDNNDMSADQFNFYSGDYGGITQRPRLFIKYYIPPAP